MFADLNLHERLLKALDALAFTQPTPVQQAAIPAALDGHNLRVTAQTGSGKTAAFGLPILHYLLTNSSQQAGHRALILAPTRELAQQIEKQLIDLARFTFLRSVTLTGGASVKEQAAALRKGPDLIIATPGRLLEHVRAGHVRLEEIELLILDEADRMLELGFAEAIGNIAAASPQRKQTLLFSATEGKTLDALIQQILGEHQHLRLNAISDLSATLSHQMITADDYGHKLRLVQWLLANQPHQKAIIFVNTRSLADKLSYDLNKQELANLVLHGEKRQDDRTAAINRLKQGAAKLLIATDVAARGLDVEGLELVINFEAPQSGDDYLHRTGRTGRAGAEGLAITLVDHTDWNLVGSIQRYLKQPFDRRVIKGLKGHYQGPKKTKSNGKAVGSKQKDKNRSNSTASAAKKRTAGARNKPRTNNSAPADTTPGATPARPRREAASKSRPARQTRSGDGSAPLRRRAQPLQDTPDHD